MAGLLSLWLPILLATVIVYIAAFIMNMVLPFHKGDFLEIADEDGFMEAMRSRGLKRGQYFFPFANSAEVTRSPEWKERINRGPVGFLFIVPKGTTMKPQLIAQFIFMLIVTIIAGYVGMASLGPGVEYLKVFQITGTAAFLGHSGSHFTNSIWYGASWRVSWLRAAEGLVYGLLTAGVFGWLWP